MSVAYLSIGSNLGDKEANIKQALKLLNESAVHILAVAPFMQTKPYGVLDQPDFVNTAASVGFEGSAAELFDVLQAVENTMGRVRKRHWGERNIDIDLLLFADEVIDLPQLKVPHPDMANREFVLAPLAAIAPLTVHPILKLPIFKLLQDLRRKE